MKILYGMFSQETNSFSVERTDLQRLTVEGWFEGEAVTNTFRGTNTYLGGMLDTAESRQAALVPTVAVATAGPPLTYACLREVVDKIAQTAEENRRELDGVCLALHGAGCAEGIVSIEAYTLERLRDILGSEIPIMLSLDLHGNISPRLLDLADGIFGIKEYPHVDTYSAGKRSMDALLDRLQGGAPLYQYLVQMPLLIPCLGGCTFQEPLMSIKNYIASYAAEKGLLDATLFHGFPYSDQESTGASLTVMSPPPPELRRQNWQSMSGSGGR